MRMRNVFSVAVVLGFFACAGYTSGPSSTIGGVPVGQPGTVNDGGPDGGDAGPDAGDAGFYDGGCGADFITQARNYCAAGQLETATGSHIGCQVSVFLSSTTCTGNIDVRTGAFDGGCGTYACTAPALPGTIDCRTGAAPCQITMCRAGQDAGCP